MNFIEDGPSLIWGVVCILLLISSLAARRLPLGYLAKAGLAWIAIFAALFAVFSFRYEFIGIWERVKADISGTAGQSITSEAISLRRQDDGHYWLQVEVNGTPVRFMIDSGATFTAMNANTATDAQVEVETGIQDNDYIEITKGVSDNEVIVCGPYSAVSKSLKDGNKVKVVKKGDLYKNEK